MGVLKKKMTKKLQEQGLYDKVVFFDTIPQTDVAKLMRICDVLVLTSAFEMFPRIVLEAQGCGLPVVSTDVGGVKKIVKCGYSGEIVTQRDPEKIAEKIMNIFRNSHLYSISQCTKRIRSFRAANMLKKVYDVYQKK
jgi:glycosyltransferase involved in cell wall biosynthesis